MTESYAETAVLVDIMDGDLDSADERLDDFTEYELRTFHDQVGLLESRIRQARRRQREARA